MLIETNILLEPIRKINFEELEMTFKETKQGEEDFIPASLRIPMHLDFDSCLEHVYYNIEKLSEMLTNEENVHPFEVLNYIMPIITNVCKLVEKPTRDRKDKNDTFCIFTRLQSCHQEDIEKFKDELNNIKGCDIYERIKNARNNTVAHINSAYEGYRATEKALVEAANYLIEHEDRLKNLVKKIKDLIHHVEISVKKEKGEPLNADTFTIKVGRKKVNC